ncbi:trypsin-like peptidase domain-containing protein [Antarctobacter jejuensis]|uniref:trypsin-like peptidase domain-containing protein n=1 Tax=Antarctobacter jejuensis TaxID=1439938 RepID=UPI003FD0E328
MKRFGFAALFAALLASPSAQAQDDMIGFDISSFGDIVLKRNQVAGDDIMLEAAFGDYNNEPISTYSAKSVFATIGRSVGRLDVATDVQVFPCTAFLVEEDLLMTNHHCVPGILDHPRAGASAIIGVRFIAGYTREGVTEGTRSFLVNPVPVETNKDLDYTLLRIIGDKPGREFGVLRLASRVPEANDPYWIIGHPMGEAQRISREKCRANAPAMSEGRLLHTCDTLPGNSGSPVIDATSQQVIGLHNAGSDRNKINYGIPMARILEGSSLLKVAPDAVDPAPQKPDRETLAGRALTEAFALQDGEQLEAGLAKLIADFPGTSAARAAQRRLDRFQRQRTDAEKRKRADEANAALLAAIVIPDVETKRATLKSLIDRYPDTPVVAAARSMLAGLNAPEPKRPVIEPGAKLTAPTKPYFLKEHDVLPEGTGITVVAEPVYKSASLSAEVLGHKENSVTLGRHVGDGWYRVAGQVGQFVNLPTGTLVHATTAPLSGKPDRPAPVTGSEPHPNGTTFKVKSARLHTAPSSSSKTVSFIYGSVTIGSNITDNWYEVAGRTGRYVQIPDSAEVLRTATTQKTAAPTDAKVTTRGTIFVPGTTLKIKSLAAHIAPRSDSRTISYIYGSVTIGRHMRDNWYGVEGKAGRYVQIPVGTEITRAKVTAAAPATAGRYPPGTKVKIKSAALRTGPSTTSKTVSYAYGQVTVGQHVRGNWYEVYGRYPKIYVELP